ncbi:hypothetical protein AK812_SmicGene8059, partial [Symbiodinium microadriaticum]
MLGNHVIYKRNVSFQAQLRLPREEGITSLVARAKQCQGHGQGAREGGILVNGVDPVVAPSVMEQVAAAAAMGAERPQPTADHVAVTMETQQLRAQLEYLEQQMAMNVAAAVPTVVLEAMQQDQPGSDRVLTAMAKGIETLLMNQNSRGEKPETVKPGITELPVLPIYTPETGSIDLINWVTHITPIMEDLSDSSSMWWSSVLKEVMEWYSRYSVA